MASRGVRRLTFEPLDEHARPALVVGAGSQLGDVVGGRIALDANDLAEIIHRVRAVSRATSHAEEEDPPGLLLDPGTGFPPSISIARSSILVDDLARFLEMLSGVAHVRPWL